MYELGVVEKESLSEDGIYLLDIMISEDDFDRFKRDFEIDLEEFFVKESSILIGD